jgi:hypothetical protein
LEGCNQAWQHHFFFESGNDEQANLPTNNINKGRWTKEEHKIFMQEFEKYGNNCMLIAKVLSTQTPAQIRNRLLEVQLLPLRNYM